MNNFFIKFNILIFLTSFFYILIYFSIDYVINVKDSGSIIFVFGDSQTYQGIDLELAKKLSGREVLSAARHGAGVYDFLIFSEKIPSDSIVVLGLSKLMQLRPNEYDRSKSGFSLTALIELYKNGYGFYDILMIARRNIRPANLFLSETVLYDNYDEIIITAPIELFENIYKKNQNNIEEKHNIMKLGIRNLIKKKCRIIFIDFPWHKYLYNIEEDSEIKKITDNFKLYINSLCRQENIIEKTFDEDKNMMYDLTHMNEYGAKTLTRTIFKDIWNRNGHVCYIFNPIGLH